MRRPRLVTLSTDVGSVYAAQMKAVLYSSLPPGTVVDLAHDLRPHAIPEAAFVLRQMAAGFPSGTIHVAVVDPGVGGPRAPLIIETTGPTYLVGPDNGVLAPLARALGGARAFRILRERLRPPGTTLGRTFEGRDVFAPAAAALARGRKPSTLGTPAAFLDLILPRPRRLAGHLIGEVLHVDRFGNLITNLPSPWMRDSPPTVELRVGVRRRGRVPWVSTYEEIPRRGQLAILGSSFGTLEVGVREGSAARRLRADLATPVHVRWARRNGARLAKEGK